MKTLKKKSMNANEHKRIRNDNLRRENQLSDSGSHSFGVFTFLKYHLLPTSIEECVHQQRIIIQNAFILNSDPARSI